MTTPTSLFFKMWEILQTFDRPKWIDSLTMEAGMVVYNLSPAFATCGMFHGIESNFSGKQSLITNMLQFYGVCGFT